MIYFLLEFVFALFALTNVANKQLSKKGYLIIFVGILLIFSSVRYYIGTDYHTYENLFNETSKFYSFRDLVNKPPHYDLGAKFIVSLLKHVFPNAIFYFFLFATITFSVLYKSILKESPYFGLSVFILFNIFLLPYVFNGMMQAVSASFLLYSTRYFHEKKILRVILITFVASSFHLVGIFIILSYFIYNIKIKKLIYLYIFIIALFISQLNVFEYLFNQYGSMVFPDTIIHRIGLYLNVFDEPINFQRIAQRSLLFFLFYFHFNKLKTLEKFNGMFNIYFMGLIIYLVLSFTELYASRLNMFFRFYEILLIPMVFLVIRPRQRLFYFVFFILWGILILSSNFSKEAYYPFKTWLLQ